MQERSRTTRQHILDAAKESFLRDGYESASVDSVCEKAGISKGAFYHHFSSKHDVFLDLLREWLTGLDSGIALLQGSASDPAEKLSQMSAILPEVMRIGEGQLPIFLEFWRQAIREKKLWSTAVAPFAKYRAELAGMVQAGTAAGAFREVDEQTAATAIVALAVGMILQGVVEPRGRDWDRTSKEAVDLLLNGLRRRPE